MRMGSKALFAFNVAFGTTALVCLPSYYFCSKKIEGKQKAVDLMMRANEFERIENLPESAMKVTEDHPFLEPVTEGSKSSGLADKEFHMYREEKKAWQEPSNETFKEVTR